MSDKGIIFSAPMVRALLDGRKTQTRRLIKSVIGTDFHRHHGDRHFFGFNEARENGQCGIQLPCLPYAPGDRLYVREAHAIVGNVDPGWVLYRANGYESECARHGFDAPPPESEVRWRPSIHMPRWASRMWLEVTDVRVQRVQEISEDDSNAEGLLHFHTFGHENSAYAVEPEGEVFTSAKHCFAALWNSLHTKPGETWTDNPWIVALTFDVRKGNIDGGQS